jgi:NADH:ubiquinone oxidoreductase subunit 6 (subunit J)
VNVAQWFMLSQVFTCFAGGLGFFMVKQPFHGALWLCYALANIAFVFIAGGAK